jgi:hypothetical protein
LDFVNGEHLIEGPTSAGGIAGLDEAASFKARVGGIDGLERPYKRATRSSRWKISSLGRCE